MTKQQNDIEYVLDDEIKRFKESALKMLLSQDTRKEGKKQLQIVKWLEELKTYRQSTKFPKKDYLI